MNKTIDMYIFDIVTLITLIMVTHRYLMDKIADAKKAEEQYSHLTSIFSQVIPLIGNSAKNLPVLKGIATNLAKIIKDHKCLVSRMKATVPCFCMYNNP